MLEAISRGKIGANRISEDALTSSVFSPLRMFSPPLVWEIISRAFIADSAQPKLIQKLVEDKPSSVKIELWPRLDAKACHREPDALISLKFPNFGLLAVIIEVKWNSTLGKDQVKLQRAALRQGRPSDHTHILNVLVVRKRKQADHRLDPSLNTEENTFVASWREIAHNLTKVTDSLQPQFGYWKKFLTTALGKTEGPPFTRFQIETINSRSNDCTNWLPLKMEWPIIEEPIHTNWRF